MPVGQQHQRNTPEHVASAIERALRGGWIEESALRDRLEKRLRDLRRVIAAKQ